MDYLREGIHLRGFAQIEPIVAYKNEAFTLFTDLMNTIWSDFARMIYHVEVEVEPAPTAAARVRAAPRAGGSSTRGAQRHLLRRRRRRAAQRAGRGGRRRRRVAEG